MSMLARRRRQSCYLKEDLARDLMDLIPTLELTSLEARTIVDATMLRIAEVLIEGRGVRFGSLFGLSVVPPRALKTLTPQGKTWTGVRKPRLKATLFQDFIRSIENSPVPPGGDHA